MDEQRSVAELKKFHEEFSKKEELYAKAQQAIQLIKSSKNENRTFNTYSKETLRKFMKNPITYQKELRNLSRFLYRLCRPYKRIIMYNASMIDLTAYMAVPLKDPTKNTDPSKVLKNYYKTLKEVEKIDLDSEIYKCLIKAWIEDTFFGVVYEDDTGFFILPLDGDYCKVLSINYDGSLNFGFDMSFFRSNPDLLGFYGEPFTSMDREYQKDQSIKYVAVPPERGICLKVNIEDMLLPIPPFIGIFEELIDLIDLRSIQNVKDNLSIYKILYAEMQTIPQSKVADDFAVDPDTAVEYYNRILPDIPPEIGTAISPVPLKVLDFGTDQTNDVNKIEEATKNLFNNSGGAQVLNSSSIKGTTAFLAAIKADSEQAIRSLLPQIQKWINRYLSYSITNPAKIIYMPVTPQTKKEYRESILKDAQYGVPVKTALATLDGLSPLDMLSMQYLENDVLKLHDNWIPLQSSFTQTAADPSSEGGAPTKEVTDLTDEGEASQDKET